MTVRKDLRFLLQTELSYSYQINSSNFDNADGFSQRVIAVYLECSGKIFSQWTCLVVNCKL